MARRGLYIIQDKLINKSYYVASLITLLLVPLIIYRADFVFNIDTSAALFTAIIILITNVYKNKISLNLKVLILACLIAFTLIIALISFGFLASAKTYIIVATVFISFVFPVKKTFIVLFFYLLIYALFGVLFLNGNLIYNFNVTDQINKPITWFVDGSILFCSSTLLLLVANKFRSKIEENLENVLVLNSNLKDRENRYKALFENNQFAVAILKDKIIVECNQRALELFKCTEEDVLGKYIWQISPEFQPDGIATIEKLKNLSQNKKAITIEWQHIDSHGKLFLVSSTITPMALASGVFLHIVMKDITEEKRIVQELETYRKNLEGLVLDRTIELENSLERQKELGILKTNFVAMASHEFRTPLASINAATDVILSYGEKLSNEDVAKRLHKIKNEVHDMTTMLEDILIIGKSNLQKLQFDPIEMDLVELVKNIILDYQLTQIKEREVIYKLSMNKIMLHVDPKWIKHIIINLFSNALKYSEAPASIGIEIQKVKNEVILSVSDKGIGISEKDKEHLFQPFHRGENVSSIPGTGLGLNVVEKAVNLHHGKIKVISEINKGTMFKAIFPIKESK
jgi:PAS domain S-box-containing protein